MLLLPFATLSTLGFLIFVLGSVKQYTGVAAIGATLVIAVGGGVALTDLKTQQGVEVTKTYKEVNNTTVVNETTKTPQYETVQVIERFGGPAGHLSLGGLIMVIGGLLFSHALNEVRP